MDVLSAIFLLVCFSSAAFAYDCVLKACFYDYGYLRCSTETTCTTSDTNGCMIKRYTGGYTTSTFHNCSLQPCVPTIYMYNGTEVSIDCCYADECNDDSMESNTITDPGVDECYSVACTTDNTESCLSNAITEGKARICQKPPDGDCFTEIVDYYITTCTSPGVCNEYQEELEIECCTGDLCNSPTEPKNGVIKTSTEMFVDSSFGTSTKNDTSGAGHQGHTCCLTCSLVILLIFIVS